MTEEIPWTLAASQFFEDFLLVTAFVIGLSILLLFGYWVFQKSQNKGLTEVARQWKEHSKIAKEKHLKKAYLVHHSSEKYLQKQIKRCLQDSTDEDLKKSIREELSIIGNRLLPGNTGRYLGRIIGHNVMEFQGSPEDHFQIKTSQGELLSKDQKADFEKMIDRCGRLIHVFTIEQKRGLFQNDELMIAVSDDQVTGLENVVTGEVLLHGSGIASHDGCFKYIPGVPHFGELLHTHIRCQIHSDTSLRIVGSLADLVQDATQLDPHIGKAISLVNATSNRNNTETK